MVIFKILVIRNYLMFDDKLPPLSTFYCQRDIYVTLYALILFCI